MSLINRPIKELTKQEFDQAYDDMVANSEGKWEKYPLPTKEEILNSLLQIGEINLNKMLELKGPN